MTDEEIAVKLTDHENEIGSLKHRMKDVEEEHKALTELTATAPELTTEERIAALESTTDDIILLMADLIGGV